MENKKKLKRLSIMSIVCVSIVMCCEIVFHLEKALDLSTIKWFSYLQIVTYFIAAIPFTYALFLYIQIKKQQNVK
ncbi:hypothetical protein KGI01_10780 [Kurthia gibsonii]|nr:hypothetical protein KGI01_10780 [Kurthia gibsonii]